MWTELANIAACSTVLFGCLAYACWCYIRPMFIRQELFQIRDKLWLDAYRLGRLTDPSYIKTRENINSTIHIASMLSVPTLISMSRSAGPLRRTPSTVSDSSEMQSAIVEADKRMLWAMLIYLFAWRASGPISIVLAAPFIAAKSIASRAPLGLQWARSWLIDDFFLVMKEVSERKKSGLGRA